MNEVRYQWGKAE